MPVVEKSSPMRIQLPVSSCREVSIGDISEEAAAAFVTTTEGNLTDRWMICNTPPTEMCLPPAPGIPEAQSDLAAAIYLLDCHRTGQCDVYNTIRLEDGQVCVNLEDVEQAPDCSEGCAWAVMEQDETPMGLSNSVFLGLIVFGLMGLIAILHIAYPVRADDESNNGTDAPSP